MYHATRSTSKGLYAKELDAADEAIRWDQAAAKNVALRQKEADRTLSQLVQNVSEVTKTKKKALESHFTSLLQTGVSRSTAREHYYGDAGSGFKTCEKGHFTRVITGELIHHLTTFFVGALSRQIPEHITGPIIGDVASKVEDHITEYVSARTATSLAAIEARVLEHTVPSTLASIAVQPVFEASEFALAHLVTRGVTHALVPTLVQTLAYGKHEETACWNCRNHGQQCDHCHHSHQQLVAAAHYSHYYESYFSDYYADYFVNTITKFHSVEGTALHGSPVVGHPSLPDTSCTEWLKKNLVGNVITYDCKQNEKARAAGLEQSCINMVLAQDDPFMDGRKLTVNENWKGDWGTCSGKRTYQ
jgi:hypothetical protein